MRGIPPLGAEDDGNERGKGERNGEALASINWKESLPDIYEIRALVDLYNGLNYHRVPCFGSSLWCETFK